MKKRYLVFLGLIVMSPAALALDAEYVIMGGFSTIVNAFTRIKIIFNDYQYSTLITAFVVLGLVSALLIKAAKGSMEYLETGKGQMGIGWLAMTLMGTMLYFGLVQNKGTIHIYDQSRNQYQAVSGVPDFMILFAGVTNQVYQAFVDMANRDTATTTRFTGEGTPIKMLLGVLNRNGAQYDPYLTDNIKSLWNQCAPVAQTRGFDPRSLKTGSAVLDVVSALSPLRNQAAYTTWHSPSNPAGASVTCDQAYISLKTDLGNPAAYNARLQDICIKNGYKANDAVQFVECKSRMEDGFQNIFGASGLSLNSAMSNVVVSQAITDAMLQNNPDVAATMIANRSMINGGMADAVTNPEWLSSIMSGVIAIILSVTPMLLLLCFTPVMGKAFVLMSGLWVFITVWQIADVLLLQAGMDEILTAMNDIRSMGLGIDAMQLGPTAAMKSMAVMASARESAVTVAVIVSSIFGISAYGLSGFGQKAMSRLDRVTEETSDKAFTHEGQGAQIEAMRRGEASLKTTGEFGGSIDMMSNASAFRESSEIHSATSQMQALGGASMAAQRTGAVDAGRAAGSTIGYENGNVNAGFSNAADTSMISTQSSVGENQGHRDSAIANGTTVTDQSRLNSGVNNTIQTADSRSNLKHGGGDLNSLSQQQGKIHGVERQVQIGSATGTQQASTAAGKSITEFTAEKTAVDSINDHASGQGQLQASGGTLGGLHSRGTFTAAAESDERTGHATALHTAYDGNGGIAQGVSESQGEHLTQNLHDMREQKANVKEIELATGGSESQARRILSESRSAEQMGVLEGNDFSPQEMQSNSAWSSKKGANVIDGEKVAYNSRGISMPETAQRRGEIDVHQSLASQDKFNTLSSALGGDRATSEALENANTSMVVTRPEAEQLGKNNLMQPTQIDAVPENGVGIAHISMREGADGKNLSTGSIQTGNSTTIDNSFRNDSGQTFGTEASAIQLLSNPQSVSQLVAASERGQTNSSPTTVAIEASRALSPIYKETAEQMGQTAIRGSASIGTPALGKLFGFSAEASANIENANMHNSNYDLMTAMFQTKVSGYRNDAIQDANVQGLSGQQREKFINDNVGSKSAILFNDVKNGIPTMLEEKNITPLTNGLHKDTPKTELANTTDAKVGSSNNGPMTSAYHYMAQKQQSEKQGETQNSSHALPFTQQSKPDGRESVPAQSQITGSDTGLHHLNTPGAQANVFPANEPASSMTPPVSGNLPYASPSSERQTSEPDGKESVPAQPHITGSETGLHHLNTPDAQANVFPANEPASSMTPPVSGNLPYA
ncbi:hypothetical protein EXT65_21145, partial [Pectobacterium carotovorum subsp. carotovorum]